MFNSEPLMGPKYWSGGRGLNNFGSILSENTCILISQIIAL